jgi:hypothetical protein
VNTRPNTLNRRSPIPVDKTGTVPVVLQYALYVILIAGAVVSIPALGGYSPLPMTMLLDGWVIILALSMLRKIEPAKFPVLILVGFYAMTRVVFVFGTEAPIVDSIQAYKWLLYLTLLVLVVGRGWTTPVLLARVTLLLVALALIKAAATRVLLGAGERPGLFTENNFEIALFTGLVAVVYGMLGRYRLYAVMALAVLTLLSGSRSGSVAVIGLVVYALSQSRVRDYFLRYLAALGLILMAAIPIVVFQTRLAASSSIDRLNFLNVFINETAHWNWLDWLVGSVPITPLSGDACFHLAYYESLLASDGSGTCYSVILHAFILRVIFDAGILGLLLAFGLTAYALRRGGVSLSLSLCLLFIALTNSFSVSGLNNAYVILPIALSILTSGMHRYTDMDSLEKEHFDR